MKQLQDKVVAIFAANGAIAQQVAMSMASEGAKVYVSGRNLAATENLAHQIKEAGGWAEAHQVDALSEAEIDAFLTNVIRENARLDVVFNGIGIRALEGAYGQPSVQLSFDNFLKPITHHLGSQFLTSRIAARHMMASQSQGTILTLTASLSRIKTPFMAGITAACSGIEGLTRSLAAEYGRAGIKVICLNPTALPETRTIRETNAANAQTAGIPADQFAEMLKQGFLLGRGPSVRDIGQLAAFLATDTGALFNSHIVDADCGTMNVI
ncbi:MAG: SDR family oxidoreductase [Bacteroidota bacterium]